MNTTPPEVFDLGTDELATTSSLENVEDAFTDFTVTLPEQRHA